MSRWDGKEELISLVNDPRCLGWALEEAVTVGGRSKVDWKASNRFKDFETMEAYQAESVKILDGLFPEKGPDARRQVTLYLRRSTSPTRERYDIPQVTMYVVNEEWEAPEASPTTIPPGININADIGPQAMAAAFNMLHGPYMELTRLVNSMLERRDANLDSREMALTNAHQQWHEAVIEIEQQDAKTRPEVAIKKLELMETTLGAAVDVGGKMVDAWKVKQGHTTGEQNEGNQGGAT